MIKCIFLFFPVFLIQLCPAHGQARQIQPDDSLAILARAIMQGKDDFIRFNASERFNTLLIRILEEDQELQTGFDSLPSISCLQASDRRFRIFTWAIPKNDRSYDFAGVLQVYDKTTRQSTIYPLDNQAENILAPETQLLNCNSWYGALYYKLIENEHDGKITYTLLGWDASEAHSRRKLIEILTITPKGKVIFGATLFSRYPRRVKRVIFEYSANTSMSLNYSNQWVTVKYKKGKKNFIKKEAAEMIVFDRLMPMQPALEGLYQYYVPESNIQDAFRFENGRWHFIREVDARNPAAENPFLPREKPELELFPNDTIQKK